MDKIATAARTKDLIRRYGFSVKKSLGQNFLVDGHVLDKIIAAADISQEDLVVEIGPGLGALTQELCRAAAVVAAVELDKGLIEILRENLAGYDNLELINADILKLDAAELIRGYGRRATVVANLPYYIATPVVMRFLENNIPVKSITVMVQKEVASRLMAKPGTKDYGALSLAVGYRAEVYYVANVPRNCFIPRPGVDSAVVRLTPRETPEVTVTDEGLMFDIIKAAFANRRKTLLNCLHHNGLGGSKEQIAKLLAACGCSENVRGEELGLVEYARLAEEFSRSGVDEHRVGESDK